ncbi:hypothetical protein ACIGXM_15650 [Kitasatospora sp. NPDC052896]|uniref:hypothetical protein n=1 Tax=Kitasatospora sp. NPDC052896 TaxID=3364061 RepID=UPI0037CB6E2C
MEITRATAITAAVGAAAALAVTGLTYSSAASQPMTQAAQAAPVVQQAATPAQEPFALAPFGNDGKGNEGKGNEGGGGEHRHHRRHHEEGRVHINERSYSSRAGDCVTVVSGLGARSLNIRNDSHRTIEVFNGAVCDNGAPIATVGPHSSADGVEPHCVGDVFVKNGVLASFRVGRDHEGGYGGGREGGYEGGHEGDHEGDHDHGDYED